MAWRWARKKGRRAGDERRNTATIVRIAFRARNRVPYIHGDLRMRPPVDLSQTAGLDDANEAWENNRNLMIESAAKNLPKPKLVIVGAGSIFFTRAVAVGMCQDPQFRGATLSLVDTNPEMLEIGRAHV